MKPRRKSFRPSRNHIVGIVTCIGAASPMVLLMVIINDLLRGASIGAVVAVFSSLPLFEFLAGCAMISLFSLPSVAAIGIGVDALSVTRRDTFIVSTACGAVIAYVALSITFKFMLGDAPVIDFQDPSNIQDAALLLLLSFMISGLYWLVAVRPDRNRRELADQHERALRAME